MEFRLSKLISFFGSFILLIIVLMYLVIPIQVSAQEGIGTDPSAGGGLVRCGGYDAQGNLQPSCNFPELIATAQRVVNWLVYFSVFVAAAMFVYAGFLYVTSAGSEEKVKKAHEVSRNVLVGFLLVLASWLIVYTISIAVIDPNKKGILLLDDGN